MMYEIADAEATLLRELLKKFGADRLNLLLEAEESGNNKACSYFREERALAFSALEKLSGGGGTGCVPVMGYIEAPRREDNPATAQTRPAEKGCEKRAAEQPAKADSETDMFRRHARRVLASCGWKFDAAREVLMRDLDKSSPGTYSHAFTVAALRALEQLHDEGETQ